MYEKKRHFEEIKVIDLLTFLFTLLRPLSFIFCLGLLLGFVFSFYSGTRRENVIKYEFALEAYERSVAYQESSIQYMKNKLLQQQSYSNSSPYMKLNPEDLYTSTISISIAPENGAYTEVVPNPSFVIATNYIEYFDAINLQEVYNSNFPHTWLRDCVTANISNNNVIIRAYANTGSEAEYLSETILTRLLQEKDNISFTSFPHEVDVKKTLTHAPSATVSTTQFNITSDINASYETIAKQEEELKAFKRTEAPSQFHPLKYGALGAVLLTVLCVVFPCIRFILNQTIATSLSMENTSSAPFLGYLSKSKKSLSDIVANERVFTSQEDARAFLNAHLTTVGPADSIAFLSSVPVPEKTQKELASYLKAKVVCVDKAVTNPKTIEAVNTSDLVILLAKPWVSKESDAKVINSIVERCGKKISGFVFFN